MRFNYRASSKGFSMSIIDKTRLLQTSMLTGLMMSLGGVAYAQSSDEVIDGVELIQETEDEDEFESGDNEVVVTGSRVKRDTFSSISPLQVITTDISQDVGLFDPASILQRSESAAGQQIDATFQGFVLDNGPGSQTLNLRGLGADRTLLLVNGRRMAPAGVQGAPTSPSINLLPGSLIDRYDLLLDGASSVYGSDAVAGVGNVILKKDFEGFEVFASGNLNEQGAGNDYTVSGSWGKNTDRGFFGVGAEYDFRDRVRQKDRDFLRGCDTHLEIDENGQRRTLGIGDRLTVEARTPGVTVSDNDCKITGISGRIFSPFQTYGSIYYQPGQGNSGITDYSESTAGGVDIDANGDGIRDVDFQDVNTNGANEDYNFISEQKRVSVMAFGEYTLEGEANVTPFFEALYVNANINSDNSFAAQIFPTVPGSNAFNPCNLANNDCAAAEVTLLGRPGANSGFSLPVIPITSIVGDRNNFDVDQEQLRLVGGVKGDIPFMNAGLFNNWSFEASGVYSKADGKANTRGIREDKLAFSLGIDPTADFNGDGVVDNDGDGIADDYDPDVFFPPTLTPCDTTALANPGLALADLTEGCVPVNLFADSVLGSAIGDFATQAERDYVFGDRSFDTVYKQTMFNAFITGNIGRTGAGPIGAVAGFEIRKDEINSLPSAVASNGLFFAFTQDRGAVGEKTVKEIFGELDIPLIADYPLFKQLDLNISGRFTDEEFYKSAGTYSIKGGWRPFDALLLKASYGTSFRAPNLRENFLLGATGFNSFTDPCAVPDNAYVNGAYTAAGDQRDQAVFDNCIREGRDPFSVGTDPILQNTQQISSVEISTGGTLDIDAERSKSFTTGFAFEQPWFDGFDFDLNVNYYRIEVTDAVTEIGAGFIISDCYTRDDGERSAFCDRIQTNGAAGSRQLINSVNAGFVNQDNEVVRGIDFNADFNKEFDAFDRTVDFGLNVRANHLLNRNFLFIDDNGLETFDEDAGEFGFPEWTGSATAYVDIDKFRFTWQARYVGKVEQDEDGIDEFDDAFASQGFEFMNTCAGPSQGDVLCRDVGFAKAWDVHTASVRYQNDTMTIRAGVTNIFDKAPPQVDGSEVFAISNTAIGNGYNYDGREFFATISKKF